MFERAYESFSNLLIHRDVLFAGSISTVTKLLGRLYYYDPASGKPGNLPANVSLSVNLVALCGTLAGQVILHRCRTLT